MKQFRDMSVEHRQSHCAATILQGPLTSDWYGKLVKDSPVYCRMCWSFCV